MHLHLHLRQCLFDFGPVYAFWCFSYERFNGILGSFHINNHDNCITLMRKFITGSQVRNLGFLNDECMQFLKFTDRNEEYISMLDAIKLQNVREAEHVSGSLLDFNGCETLLSLSKSPTMLMNVDFKYLTVSYMQIKFLAGYLDM